jgi:hypothetical protein
MQQVSHRQASLLEAIIAATPQFGEITKDSENAYLKSKYLKLPGLLKAIKGPLLEQGVVIYTQVTFAECGWVVRTTLHLIHTREELSSDFPIPDPSNQQRVGSVVTYGTRYNLFALLALCPEDADDDGNAGAINATAATVQPLPGLPSPAAWPQPGQQVVAPPAMLPASAYHQGMPAQNWQPQPPMALMQNPVQPFPVLQ